MCHVAASMSEKFYLLPCGFLKLLYLSFLALQSKLDIDTIVFCLKNAEDNSVIFSVGIFNISYLKAHFKTTTTMVSTNFNMNLISEEWIIDGHIASKKGETFKVKCYPLTMSARSSHFSIPPPFPRSATVQSEIVPTPQCKFQSNYYPSHTIHHAFI